jgi:hypothetical protein
MFLNAKLQTLFHKHWIKNLRTKLHMFSTVAMFSFYILQKQCRHKTCTLLQERMLYVISAP